MMANIHMTNRHDIAKPDDDRPAFEIEITEEMIKAGIIELREAQFGQPMSEIVEAVYLAMELERP